MELNGVQKCMLRRAACGEGYGWGTTSFNSIGRIHYSQCQVKYVETAYAAVSPSIILSLYGIDHPKEEGLNCLLPRVGRRV